MTCPLQLGCVPAACAQSSSQEELDSSSPPGLKAPRCLHALPLPLPPPPPPPSPSLPLPAQHPLQVASVCVRRAPRYLSLPPGTLGRPLDVAAMGAHGGHSFVEGFLKSWGVILASEVSYLV